MTATGMLIAIYSMRMLAVRISGKYAVVPLQGVCNRIVHLHTSLYIFNQEPMSINVRHVQTCVIRLIRLGFHMLLQCT